MAFVKWGVELSPTEPVKATLSFNGLPRSEERRVGKECRL